MERPNAQSHITNHLADHLTDEQFAALLLGTSPAAVQSHLKACSECADEADRVAGAIGSFSQQSRLWAERRVAARPMAPARTPSFEWLHRPQAWTAAALTVALAAGFAVARSHQAPVVPTQIARIQSAPTVTPSTLKADNDLLSAIDGELRADESTPSIAYGLNTSAHGVRTRPAKKAISE